MPRKFAIVCTEKKTLRAAQSIHTYSRVCRTRKVFEEDNALRRQYTAIFIALVKCERELCQPQRNENLSSELRFENRSSLLTSLLVQKVSQEVTNERRGWTDRSALLQPLCQRPNTVIAVEREKHKENFGFPPSVPVRIYKPCKQPSSLFVESVSRLTDKFQAYAIGESNSTDVAGMRMWTRDAQGTP